VGDWKLISIEEAIYWDHVNSQVLLYSVVGKESAAPKIKNSGLPIQPIKASEAFELESARPELEYYRFFVNEFWFPGRLTPAASVLEPLLRAATASASFAWLMYEGQFSFDHLLDHEISSQIYGYCWSNEEPVLAKNAEQMSEDAWRNAVTGNRQRLLSAGRHLAS